MTLRELHDRLVALRGSDDQTVKDRAVALIWGDVTAPGRETMNFLESLIADCEREMLAASEPRERQ